MGRYKNDEEELWDILGGPDAEAGEAGSAPQKIPGENVLYIPETELPLEEVIRAEGGEPEYADSIVLEVTDGEGGLAPMKYELVGRLDNADRSYLVLYPMENNPDRELQVVRFTGDEEGNVVLHEIEDPAEIEDLAQQIRELFGN